jgi:hypothetical protein
MLSEVSGSEPESPINPIFSSQMSMPLSQQIQGVLELLRARCLSPFDIILEILDEEKPHYSYYRTQFYKDGNQKLEKILNIMLANNSGKRNFRHGYNNPQRSTYFVR